jgi:hypothetical protein
MRREPGRFSQEESVVKEGEGEGEWRRENVGGV